MRICTWWLHKTSYAPFRFSQSHYLGFGYRPKPSANPIPVLNQKAACLTVWRRLGSFFHVLGNILAWLKHGLPNFVKQNCKNIFRICWKSSARGLWSCLIKLVVSYFAVLLSPLETLDLQMLQVAADLVGVARVKYFQTDDMFFVSVLSYMQPTIMLLTNGIGRLKHRIELNRSVPLSQIPDAAIWVSIGPIRG